MRKIIVHFETGYCGEDSWEAYAFPDSTSDRVIENDLYYNSIEHAQSWDHSDEYEDDEDYDEIEDLEQRACFTWFVYDPEEHDMYRSGGGSFEEDYAYYK